LLYTGDFISAPQAYEYGLYNRVVKPEDLESETQAWAEKLANGPGFSIGLTKEMLNRELNMDLLTALEAEAQAQALCMFNPDYREAYEAFVEKREPRFNRK
jgi:enoyl-CoA hydratase/carnithine racemase